MHQACLPQVPDLHDGGTDAVFVLSMPEEQTQNERRGTGLRTLIETRMSSPPPSGSALLCAIHERSRGTCAHTTRAMGLYGLGSAPLAQAAQDGVGDW